MHQLECHSQKQRRSWLPLLALSFAVIGSAAIHLAETSSAAVISLQVEEDYLPVEEQGQEQRVVFEEFSDFQCPNSKAGQEIIERVLAVFGDEIDYRFRSRPLNLHSVGYSVAARFEALLTLDSERAHEFRRQAFANQGAVGFLGGGYLDRILEDLGFDPKLIAEESQTDRIARLLEDNRQEGRRLGLSGTPGYVVNGVVFDRPTSFREFEKVICGAISRRRPAEVQDGNMSIEDCWAQLEPDWIRLSELEDGSGAH